MEDKSRLGSMYGSVVSDKMKAYFFDQILDRVRDWALAEKLECGCEAARRANSLSAFGDIQDIIRDYYKSETGGCPYAE